MEAFINFGRALRNTACVSCETLDKKVCVYNQDGNEIISVKSPQFDYYYYRSADGSYVKERITKEKSKFCKRDKEFLQSEGWKVEECDYFKDRYAERTQ